MVTSRHSFKLGDNARDETHYDRPNDTHGCAPKKFELPKSLAKQSNARV